MTSKMKWNTLKLFSFIFILLIFSCSQEDLYWNLPRTNELDSSLVITNSIALDTNDCNSLIGISSLYQGMNGTSGLWGISNNGYNGTCWCAPNPIYSGNLGSTVGTHYIQFNRNFTKNGYLEFWLNTNNPGFNNLIPSVFVDDSLQITPYSIDGQTSSFYWQKLRSGIIQPGNHSIRIQFSGSYYTFKVDEITFFEAQ